MAWHVAGSSSSCEPPPATAEADVVAVERRQAQDDFLILASDGLWGAARDAGVGVRPRPPEAGDDPERRQAAGAAAGRQGLADRARQGARRAGGARRLPGQRQRRPRPLPELLASWAARMGQY